MANVKSKIRIVDSKLIEQRDYWLTRLSQELQPSCIKPDFSRPDSYPAENESLEIRLNDELFRKLEQVSGNSQFLLYTTLMAALQVCLYKHTNSSTIRVGSPSRRRRDVSGQSPNALVILNEIDDRISFRQF